MTLRKTALLPVFILIIALFGGCSNSGMTGVVDFGADESNPTSAQLNDSIAILKARLADKGYKNAVVSIENPNGIKLLIPNLTLDQSSLFRLAQTIDQKGEITFKDSSGAALLSNSDIKSAKSAKQSGQYVVILTLNADGAKKFADATAANINKPISVYIDTLLLGTIMVQSPVTNGQAVISKDFTQQQTKDIASIIQTGVLPLQLTANSVSAIRSSK